MAAPVVPMAQQESEIASRIESFLEAEEAPQEAVAPAPEPAGEEEVGQPTDEAEPAEAPEAPEEPAAEPESEPIAAEAAAAPEEEVEGPPGIETTAQLAEAFGVDEGKVLEEMSVVVDDQAVSLQTLVERYQDPGSAMEPEALVQARQQYETARTTHENQLGQSATRMQTIANGMMGWIEGDKKGLESMKDINPSEYIRMRDSIDQRMKLVDQSIQEFKRQDAEYHQRQEQDQAQFVERENASILRKMPAWKEPEVAKAAMLQVKKTMTDAGFNNEEITGLADHRAVLVAWKASEYDRVMARVKDVKGKRGLQLPKVLKAAARKETSKRSEAAKSAKAKMDRLRKTGSDEAATEVFLDILGGE